MILYIFFSLQKYLKIFINIIGVCYSFTFIFLISLLLLVIEIILNFKYLFFKYLFLKVFLKNLFVPVSARWRYLAKKYRSKKETTKREITHAWKNSEKLDTYKGFYIPKPKPKDNLAKFFFKKREESSRSNFRWKKNYKKSLLNTSFSTKKVFLKKSFFEWSNAFKLKSISSTKKKIILNIISSRLKKLLWINFLFLNKKIKKKKKFFKSMMKYPLLATNLIYLSSRLRAKWRKLRRRKWKTLKYWAKSFKVFLLKPSFSPLNLKWFIQSKGISSKAFLNYFLLSKRPIYLSSINFFKIKLIFFKYIKRYLYNRLKLNKRYSFYKRWKSSSILWSKNFLSGISVFLNNSILNNSFSFFTKYFIWLQHYLSYLYAWNYLFVFLLFSKKTFFNWFFIVFINYIFSWFWLFSKIKWKRNRIALRLFFSRLLGFQFSFFWKKWKKWKFFFTFKLKYSITIKFLQRSLNKSFFLNYFFCWNNFFIQTKKKYLKKNFFFFDFVTLFSKIYKELYTTIYTKSVFLLSPIQIFFHDFSWSIKKKSFFKPTRRNISYFYYLYNLNMLRYKDLLSLFDGSFTQQLDLNVNLNLIHMFFWALIWRGKKLTAWWVLKNFLIWFRSQYWIPGLIFLTHTILKLEPWIWLKKKWLAGWVYEIPLFISSRRSKAIAIWWLIKAAKKRKKYDFSEGLSNELWECAFNWGPTIALRKSLHFTAKRNRSYTWWL